MGSAPKPHFSPPPDPRETADVQRAYSMVEQQNPWFRKTYEKSGLSPSGIQQYREVVALSPEAQRMHDLQTQIRENYLNRAAGAIAEHQAPIDFSVLPEVTAPDQAAYDRTYQGYMDRFRPDIVREEERRRQALFSRGFGAGSEVQNQLREQTNDQLQKLRFGADQAAYQRMMAEFGAQQQARNQALQEQVQEYQLNSPLMQLGQIQPFLPQSQMMPLGNPSSIIPDYMSAQQQALQQQNAIAQANYQNAMNKYNARNKMLGTAAMGAGMMLGGPLASALGGSAKTVGMGAGMLGSGLVGGLFGG